MRGVGSPAAGAVDARSPCRACGVRLVALDVDSEDKAKVELGGLAALDDAAVMFASTSNHGNPSTIVYRPLSSWAPNSDWQVQLDKGEEAVAIAVGHKFAAIATSKPSSRNEA